MKAFIAYRSTGENQKLLKPLLNSVRDTLKAHGIDSYCNFFDEQEFIDKSYSPRQILLHGFKNIDKSDFLFVLQTSDNRSGGMLMEIGYSIAKCIPVVAAVKDGLEFKLIASAADTVLPWTDNQNLIEAIRRLDISNIENATIVR